MAVSKNKIVKKNKEKLLNKRKEPTCGYNSVNRDDSGKKLKLEDLKERPSTPRSNKGGNHDMKEYQRVKSRKTDREVKSVLHEENRCFNSQPTPLTTNATVEGGHLTHDVQLCLKHELRVALLKSQYAGIIVKSQESLINHGEISDPLKIQQEKERFENLQCEEISKIKYEMAKTEEDAPTTMSQREKEREATRLALQQMTKTVDLYDNLWA